MIGCAAASFWRGAWYIMDDQLYPEQPFYSALASLVLGSMGLFGIPHHTGASLP